MIGILLTTTQHPHGDIIDPVQSADLGDALRFTRNRWSRSYERYTYAFDLQDINDAETLRYFVRYMRGVREAWYDAGIWQTVTEPQPFDIADGVRTQFRLPIRYVSVASTIIYVNDQIDPTPSVIGDSGIVTFTSAPAANSILKFRCSRRSKVKIEVDGDVALEQEDRFKYVNTARLVLMEIP
jgi:hypothetical protein